MSGCQSDEFKRPRKVSFSAAARVSRPAIAALVCSLIVFVPLAPLVAVLLGLAALWKIKKSSMLKGKPIAVTAMMLGVVFSLGQLGVGSTALALHQRVNHGPQLALAAGFTGDTGKFLDAFVGSGLSSKHADAEAFLDELRQRYGDFIDGQILQPVAGHELLSASGQKQLYRLFFLNRSVMAEASVVVFDESGLPLPSNRLGYLTVRDEEQGDLTFPGPTRVAAGN